jgi:hypothetical protein
MTIRMLPTGLICIFFMLVTVSCGGDDNPTGNAAGPSNVGFGVSGLLFNNNLILYDRARSECERTGADPSNVLHQSRKCRVSCVRQFSP